MKPSLIVSPPQRARRSALECTPPKLVASRTSVSDRRNCSARSRVPRSKLTTVPIDVFVGEDGLVRRLTLASGGERVSVDFWDFGADVDVPAPPAADVQRLDG